MLTKYLSYLINNAISDIELKNLFFAVLLIEENTIAVT